MAIEFRCEQCDKKLKVKDELGGKKIKCPGCGEATAVPAAGAAPAAKASSKPAKQELNPDLNSTESIINLNLKKFKNKEIDPDDESVNLDELEGAVVLRKKREQAALAGPPPEPLQPVDWVLGLIAFPIALIMAIVYFAKGKRSRGLKLLGLCGVMIAFFATVVTLFILTIGSAISR